MARRPTRRISAPDGIILAGVLGYLAWSFVPGWYRAGGGTQLGIPIPATNLNAWRGATLVGIAAAALAAVLVLARAARLRAHPALDLGLALLGSGATVAGAVLPPEVGSWSWGLGPGLLAALVWVYGAQWRFRAAGTSRP